MRIEVLHFLTGLDSTRNQFLVKCVLMPDSILRATGSAVRERVIAELCQPWEISKAGTEVLSVKISEDFVRQTTTQPLLRARKRWFYNSCAERSVIPPGAAVTSMFASSAPDLRSFVISRMMTYQFADASSRLELAVQVLDFLGCAPECLFRNPANTKRSLPPQLGASARRGYAAHF